MSWSEPGTGAFRLVLVDDTGVSVPATLAEETFDQVIGASVLAMPDDSFLAYWSSREAGDYFTRPRFSFVRASRPSDDAGTSDGGLPGLDAGLPSLDGARADGGSLSPGGGGACAAGRRSSGSLGWAMAAWVIGVVIRRRRSA